jgi:hypothetical protein
MRKLNSTRIQSRASQDGTDQVLGLGDRETLLLNPRSPQRQVEAFAQSTLTGATHAATLSISPNSLYPVVLLSIMKCGLRRNGTAQ